MSDRTFARLRVECEVAGLGLLSGGRWRRVTRRWVPGVVLALVTSLAAFSPTRAATAAAPRAPEPDVSVPVSVGTAGEAARTPTDGAGVTSVDRRTQPGPGSGEVATTGAVVDCRFR
jgi:hypothetical protein